MSNKLIIQRQNERIEELLREVEDLKLALKWDEEKQIRHSIHLILAKWKQPLASEIIEDLVKYILEKENK